MKRLLLLLLFASYAAHIYGQASNFPEREGVELHPRWVDNLTFLTNTGDGIPFVDQALYNWAEAHLSNYPDRGFADLASYGHFQRFTEKHGIRHIGGPMLGNITDTSVDIWLRTVKPDSISVKIEVAGKERVFGPVLTTLESELSCVVHITGLQPGKSYPYRVYVSDTEIDIPDNALIKTTKKTNYSTRISFGSCFHRWGLGNLQLNNTILERNTTAFVGLGDIVTQDRMDHLGWHSMDYLARDLYPAWQKLVASVPFYALWDDHDYFGNDLWGIPKGFGYADRDKVWKAFRYAWNNPSYGFGDQGVFFKTTIGDIDLITVDHRYFRTKESFLGNEQMEWLENELKSSTAPFIVLACGSMWSDYVSEGKDSWGVFDPAARDRLFNFIEEEDIKGVLLISGDRHGSRGFRIERPSGYSFFEFEVASLGGLAGPPAKREEWDTQFYGLSGGYAFGEFTFDTESEDPTVTFQLVSETGETIYEKVLKRSILTPANYR